MQNVTPATADAQAILELAIDAATDVLVDHPDADAREALEHVLRAIMSGESAPAEAVLTANVEAEGFARRFGR
jgi:hypothetical protein